MAEEEPNKKAEAESPMLQTKTPPQQTLTSVGVVVLEDPTEEVEGVVEPAPIEEPTHHSEPNPITIQKVIEASEDTFEVEKPSTDGLDKNAKLTRVETEKRMSLIKAWEESEKCKVENKAHKKKAIIEAWENIKKASLEAQLRKIEQCLEKKKAEYTEKMKNKMAMIHKEAEEKKAMVEAKLGEDLLKVDDIAYKCRATGKPPRKLLVLF